MKLRNRTQYNLYCAMSRIHHTNPRWLNYACYYGLYVLAVVVGSALSVSIGEYIIKHWM